MSREIRRVPENWQHPKIRGTGEYESLLSDYAWYVDCWANTVTKEVDKIKEKADVSLQDAADYLDGLASEEYLAPPNPRDFMPSGTWFQLYQTVSEGTPLTPPFASQEELVTHLTTLGTFWDSTPWSVARAEGMVSQGFCMSGMMDTATGKMSLNEEVFDK